MRVSVILGSAVTLIAATAAALAVPGAAHAAVTGLVRVDQAGFLPTDTKQAYLMTSGAVSGETFAVVSSSGATVLTGNVGSTSRGSWNTAYPDVYPIDFGGLSGAGTYHLQVSGTVSASSPTFSVQNADSLFGKLVSDGVGFFQAHRDGQNVLAGSLNRQPSHLNDATANVYAVPAFQSGGSDVITNSDLTKIGGPVNVAGGWFDAGDYLKFTFTTAYADTSCRRRSARSAAPRLPASAPRLVSASPG